MVHEDVLVFSSSELNHEKIEKLFDKIFYCTEWGDYTVDAYSGVIKFYLEDESKKIYFMQLRDLWQLSESEIYGNLSSPSYITIDDIYKENPDFTEILTYARNLPDTTWIAKMNIAP